jgi:hypothetical protein
MKYIVVLLMILLSSCTGNSRYTVMFEDGQIEEVDNTTGATFNKGDTLVIYSFFGKSAFVSRDVYGKYINSLPSYQKTYGEDSFLYFSVYNKAVVLK